MSGFGTVDTGTKFAFGFEALAAKTVFVCLEFR